MPLREVQKPSGDVTTQSLKSAVGHFSSGPQELREKRKILAEGIGALVGNLIKAGRQTALKHGRIYQSIKTTPGLGPLAKDKE